MWQPGSGNLTLLRGFSNVETALARQTNHTQFKQVVQPGYILQNYYTGGLYSAQYITFMRSAPTRRAIPIVPYAAANRGTEYDINDVIATQTKDK